MGIQYTSKGYATLPKGKVKIIWFLFFILFLSIGFKTLIQMQEYF